MSDFLGIVYTNDSDQAFSNSGAKTAMISVPSRRNLRSESVGKCSTCQSFTRTESPSCRIGTLTAFVFCFFWGGKAEYINATTTLITLLHFPKALKYQFNN